MQNIVGVIALTLFGSLFSSGEDKTQRTSAQPVADAKPESSFICYVYALTSRERNRHFNELGPMLRKLKTAVRELPDGYEFRFPTDWKTIQLVAEWIAGERLCCPFFEIELRVGKEGGPLWLRLTGREGTKQFIQSDAADWIK